jgi:ubiquitin C-terminal hydrolase
MEAKKLKNVLVLKEPEHYKNNQLKLTVGLQNLGNTCYMASLLQAMKLIKSLRDEFLSLSNEQLKPLIENEKPHQTNVLPYVVDFLRNVSYNDEASYFPWLIKGAIGVNNYEVSLIF